MRHIKHTWDLPSRQNDGGEEVNVCCPTYLSLYSVEKTKQAANAAESKKSLRLDSRDESKDKKRQRYQLCTKSNDAGRFNNFQRAAKLSTAAVNSALGSLVV